MTTLVPHTDSALGVMPTPLRMKTTQVKQQDLPMGVASLGGRKEDGDRRQRGEEEAYIKSAPISAGLVWGSPSCTLHRGTTFKV